MEIYELTRLGEFLAHNTRAPDNPKWRVIFFLKRNGAASKEKILSSVPEASGWTLLDLKRKRVIAVASQAVAV
jgi:hypothetical protein